MNENGGNMEREVSTDAKTIKMFRRLERFLDGKILEGRPVVHFKNAETGRVFAVFMTPEQLQEILAEGSRIEIDLDAALETIGVLEDDNALLDIIDGFNDVLQGRVSFDEVTRFVNGEGLDAVGSFGAGPLWNPEANDPINKGTVTITDQEFEELLNLRRKRTNDHAQLSAMDARLKEMKKAIQTLESSRDHWKAAYYELEDKYLLTPNMPDIKSPTLKDLNVCTTTYGFLVGDWVSAPSQLYELRISGIDIDDTDDREEVKLYFDRQRYPGALLEEPISDFWWHTPNDERWTFTVVERTND
jgi:hypothetical protein